MEYDIPFFGNTKDDTHCYQAAIKMLAKYVWPEQEYSWEELDRITAKAEGLWTWPMAGILWLHSRGVDVVMIDPFDYDAFIREKGNYLIREYGEEVGNAQITHSNIDRELRYAKELTEKVAIQKRIPTRDDITRLLRDGYILICNVNSKSLREKPGYTGHFVVVTGFDKTGLWLHDPGLPPREHMHVANALYEKAWAYPNEKAKNITAFRLKRSG